MTSLDKAGATWLKYGKYRKQPAQGDEMNHRKAIGRRIGILIFAHILTGTVINFVLLPSAFAPPGFLVNAAAHAMQVSLAVFLGLAAGAVTTAVAVTALPLFRQYSEALALWVLALGIVGLSLAVVEYSAVMSMLSFSQAYANAGAADAATFEAMRIVVASSRNWAHYTHLLIAGSMYLVFYYVLYRFALIPRALAGFGVLAVALQMTAVSMPIIGIKVIMLMVVPLGLAHLALALWLTIKGFGVGLKPDLRGEIAHAPAA